MASPYLEQLSMKKRESAKLNQRTNGPVNAQLLSGPTSISINHTKPDLND